MAPPGWKVAYSSRVRPRASRSATASASPMASATVVDAVGTRLNGQASRSTEASSTTSECLARVEAKSPVRATMRTPVRLRMGSRLTSSSDSPE